MIMWNRLRYRVVTLMNPTARRNPQAKQNQQESQPDRVGVTG
jgi:hypothetical protein